MEYNLAGLSWRYFEQLVQALAAKVLGPKTIIFGDGPDGAREATYDGSLSYPNDREPWSGYLVVQAKFRQKPNPKDDNAWALEQLKGELEKFSNNARGLRTPDYYIFATNVSLSARANTGGKDKASQLIAQYKK